MEDFKNKNSNDWSLYMYDIYPVTLSIIEQPV